MIEKNVSTRFSHDADVGVKCSVIRGLRASQLRTASCLWWRSYRRPRALHPRIRLGHLFQEPEELLMTMPRVASVDDLAGGHLQRREQRRGAVTDVVVSAFGRQPRTHRQHRLSAVQGLNLTFFRPRTRPQPAPGVQAQPDHVDDLGFQFRVGTELERVVKPRAIHRNALSLVLVHQASGPHGKPAGICATPGGTYPVTDQRLVEPVVPLGFYTSLSAEMTGTPTDEFPWDRRTRAPSPSGTRSAFL